MARKRRQPDTSPTLKEAQEANRTLHQREYNRVRNTRPTEDRQPFYVLLAVTRDAAAEMISHLYDPSRKTKPQQLTNEQIDRANLKKESG